MKNDLTELEIKVVDAIKKGDDYDDMPSQCIGNITDLTGLSTKILRGVLSSLLQKDILSEGEYPNGMKAFQLNDY